MADNDVHLHDGAYAYNAYLTRRDGSTETLYGVLFMGLQDGSLLFAQPGTLARVDPVDGPAIAPETVPLGSAWQCEGGQAVDVITVGLADVVSIEVDWLALSGEPPATETDE